MTKIHAIFANGVFRPVEPVDIGEGTQLELSFESPVSAPAGEGFRKSFGAWADDATELDQFVEESRQARKQQRSSPLE